MIYSNVQHKTASFSEGSFNYVEANSNSKDKSTKKTNDNQEVIFLDNKDDIELTDEMNNTRKKRRRSSAGIE